MRGDTMGMPEAELSQETIDGLSAFLADPARPAGTLSYTALRGYLFAVGNSPEVLPPSLWVGRIFGEGEVEFQSEAEVAQAFGRIMGVWNDVQRISRDEKIAPDELLGAEDSEPVRREWSSGFAAGWKFVQEDWIDGIAALSEKHREWFGLCQFCLCYFSDPDRYHEEWEISEEGRETWAARMNELFPSALEFYAKIGATLTRMLPSMGRGAGGGGPIRVEKRPGRNDPCPCGSGKKYKKCCLN